MDLAKIIASVALLLVVVIAAGHARSEENAPALKSAAGVTAQKKIDEREAKRQADIAEHEKRKEELSRHCTRPLDTPADLEACKAVYKKM